MHVARVWTWARLTHARADTIAGIDPSRLAQRDSEPGVAGWDWAECLAVSDTGSGETIQIAARTNDAFDQTISV